MKKFQNAFLANLVSSYMRSLGIGLFTTRTVGELLWGYQDNLLTSLQKIQPQLDDVFGLFYKVSVRRIIMCSWSLRRVLGLTLHPCWVSLTEQRFQRRSVRLLHRGTKLPRLCQGGHVERWKVTWFCPEEECRLIRLTQTSSPAHISSL